MGLSFNLVLGLLLGFLVLSIFSQKVPSYNFDDIDQIHLNYDVTKGILTEEFKEMVASTAKRLNLDLSTWKNPNCPVGEHIDRNGTLVSGAQWRYVIPANWNGVLLALARGFSKEVPSLESVFLGDLGTAFLEYGYGLAGTSYSKGGWSVKEGAIETGIVVKKFQAEVCKPKLKIIVGTSMGSLISNSAAEDGIIHGGVYDGSIGACGVMSGATRAWDLSLRFRIGYDAVLGFPSQWGTVGNLKPNISAQTDVIPVLYPVYLSALRALNGSTDPTDKLNLARVEFVRFALRLPMNGFYGPGTPFIFKIVAFCIDYASQLQHDRGGNPTTNAHTIPFSLSDEQRLYLEELGLNTTAVLKVANSYLIKPNWIARNYLKSFYDFKGNLRTPVLNIHTEYDGIAPVYTEDFYKKLLHKQKQSDKFFQVFTNGLGHCEFTGAQLFQTVLVFQSWLQNGFKPTAESFTAPGFLNDYVPPSWVFTKS